MAEEPREIFPVVFYGRDGVNLPIGKDFAIYAESVRDERDAREQEPSPEELIALEDAEDPKGLSATESVEFSDLIPTAEEADLVDAETDPAPESTELPLPTSSTTPTTSDGKPEQVVEDKTLNSGSQILPKDETKLASSASSAPSLSSVETTVSVPVVTRASGQVSSTMTQHE